MIIYPENLQFSPRHAISMAAFKKDYEYDGWGVDGFDKLYCYWGFIKDTIKIFVLETQTTV